MHAAAARYSPVALVAREAETGIVPAVPLFVVHGRRDTLSPYASQMRFVEELRVAHGPDMVELVTLEGWHWQHMNTTVTFHKRAVEQDDVLQALFAWLNRVTDSN